MDAKNNVKLNNILGQTPEWLSKMTEFAKPFIDIQKALEPIQPLLDAAKVLGETITEYFEKLPADLVLLGQYGWFLELDEAIDQSKELATMLSEGHTAEVDKRLMEFYSDSMDRIVEVLSKRHSARSELIKQYKELHLEGRYFSAIPLILSQIDGVCKDVTRQVFFMKDKKSDYQPKAVVELEGKVGQLTDLLLAPLKQQTPILAHESRLSEFPCQFNRHRVMHGDSLDYGTELNSLKSLSLLKYISDVLDEIDINKSMDASKNKKGD